MKWSKQIAPLAARASSDRQNPTSSEKTMIVFIVFAFCAAYFFYMKQWAESFLSREYNFASPSPPEPLPHSPTVSSLVAILWGVSLLGGVFWGFTFLRYPDHLSVQGSDLEIVLLILLSIAVALSYFVVYRLGEIRGVANMKSTDLFIAAMHAKQSSSGGASCATNSV